MESEAGVRKHKGKGSTQVLSRETDGSVVEAQFLGGGSILAEVVSKHGSSKKTLGMIKVMVDNKKGTETLQGICKVHSRCKCWLSNTQHSDLLIQWLAKGGNETYERHSVSSTELKKSIGMKIRG